MRQLPERHVWRVPQRFPQRPQFIASLSRSTHTLPWQLTSVAGHAVVPLGHAIWQSPPMQALSTQHTRPHAPQWLASVAVFTHAVPQQVRPSVQVAQAAVQRPPMQSRPAGQALSHPPQCARSVEGSTQKPQRSPGLVQAIVPGLHTYEHRPPEQT